VFWWGFEDVPKWQDDERASRCVWRPCFVRRCPRLHGILVGPHALSPQIMLDTLRPNQGIIKSDRRHLPKRTDGINLSKTGPICTM